MSYYFTKSRPGNFETTIERVSELLKNEGFGILTTIDVKETLKNKIGTEFYNYKILGACNPVYAHKALQSEDKIGTMLPCNVIVQERIPGEIEVSAVDPVSSMLAIKNEALGSIASEVREKLKNVIDKL